VSGPADSIPRPRTGTLWLVATPIGNLGDLSPRAAEMLARADLLLAEDTRHTSQLLAACGIRRPSGKIHSLHDHNERARALDLVERLRAGEEVALVSDAGTPLVSDPGAVLVAAAVAAGIDVRAVPGPCAAIAALSLAALPADRFCFEGFLPARDAARRSALEALERERRTLVFYEAPHRIAAALADMAAAFGATRPAAVARELTKMFETVYRGPLGELAERAAGDPDLARGELVIVVHGAVAPPVDADDPEIERVLRLLLAELPVSQAARLAARVTGRSRNELYERALALNERADDA
jgi:16S rRNA (cytidine1402-2'-O)-methyltransferase